MNEEKVCFIFCSNDSLYTEECIYYIHHLNIPIGYRIEILEVKDAKSMASGYNEAMRQSDAKYKVYMHQDTFIVNADFIFDFLKVFQEDRQIGMIGMIGTPKLPESGIMWETERCGAIYTQSVDKALLLRLGDVSLKEVEAVDGLLMITQYDIPWRDDLFDKWHFYDCAQSLEFIRKGYKVVVPAIDEPWCMHDTSMASTASYEEERGKFLREYKR